MFAKGDGAQWEFIGHYFYNNISLIPVPHLNLYTDRVFYPYGVNAVFMPWSIEREYFFSIFFGLFGTGPWLFIYYIVSLLITCLGLFALFKKDFGILKASMAGLLTVFFNFYALAKFPEHFNIAILHWTILGIAVDYLIVRRITAGTNIGFRLLLLRCLLTALSIGLDICYVAGSSLFSLTICLFYVVFFLLVSCLKKGKSSYRFKELMKKWKQEIIDHKKQCIILLSITLVFIFLYFPIVLQIYLTTKEFAGIPQGGTMWSSPWRILIPWLPWLNPGMNDPALLKGLINDFPEGLGAGSPGFFLLFAGLSGIFFSHRKSVAIPFAIIFTWIVFNHPYQGFSITIFPWFKYSRIGSRFTMLMAPLLILFALELPISKFKKSYLSTALFILLSLTGALEFYTFSHQYHFKSPNMPENFLTYMETVKNTQGEAVMDWPFCIAGGNGVGTNLLGSFYNKNNTAGFMQRYHGKKVVGNYFGRLSLIQIEPFLQAGWNKMFHPDKPNYFKSTRQAIPMTELEWAFFDDFYTLNDFCGINLYPGLLAPGDKQKFYKRFGKPEVITTIADGLKIVFIAKDQKRRSMVNKFKGKKVIFLFSVKPGNTIDMVKTEVPPEIIATGMFELRRNKSGLFRIAGNSTGFLFKSKKKQTAELTLTCYVKSPVKLIINNKIFIISKNWKGRINFNVKKGINHIKIKSDSGKGKKGIIAFNELKLKIQ